MKNEKLLKILKNFFKDAEAIYIFGSFANNTFNENSDIDIAILYKNRIDRIKLFNMQNELSLKFNKNVDLVDLQDINDVFAYEIINKSKKLKTSKFAKEYEFRVWLRYIDWQEMKEIIATLRMCENIKKYVKRIEEDYDEEFEDSYTKQDAVILNIQRAIQQTIDLGAYIVKKYKLGIPKSSKEIFEILEKEKIIDKTLSKNLQKMVGFRNLAIHEYTKLKLEVIEYIIKERIFDCLEFQKRIIKNESNDK